MDLHAFLINQIEPLDLKKDFFCLFVFCLAFVNSKANRQVQLSQEVPYEINFADVVFKLNDATRFLVGEEINKLENNQNLKLRNLELLNLFLPELKSALEKSIVPADFLYLSFYNVYQLNAEKGTNLEEGVFWCLKETLAKDLDLRVNEKIDERKNFYIATDGALKGLRRNNVLYNNWGSTLFAQLASRELINSLGINKSWEGEKFLALESPAYSSLIKFLAFKMVLEKEFPRFQSTDDLISFKYQYGKGKTLEIIAADLRLDIKEVKKTNLWLKEEAIKEDLPVLLLVPSFRFSEIKSLSELSRYNNFHKNELGFPVLDRDFSLAKNKGGDFYRINGKNGIMADICDSYVTLAYKADVSIKDFLSFNDMSVEDVLSIGQVYYLESKYSKGSIGTHIALESESLWDISMLYGVKLDEIQKYNRLEGLHNLQPGMLVYLQGKRSKKKPIEFVVLNDNSALNIDLKNDPILSTVSSFDWPVVNVKETAVLEESEKEVKTLIKKEKELIRKDVVVKPVLKDTFSKNLKSKVLGIVEVPDFVVHTVKRGETLYRISVNYRVSVNQLFKLNELSSHIIEIGDKIKVKPI
jgi:membrane-bound lytic murein transglycosylase D